MRERDREREREMGEKAPNSNSSSHLLVSVYNLDDGADPKISRLRAL
jgi:hypothetical protein